MIELRKVSKLFETKSTEVEAVNEVSLKINKGEIFGIIGLSGAGKSTLVRCINYLEKPTSGQVLFNGTDLATLSENELRKIRKSMSMIFQNFNLLAQRTALKNVCFPLELSGVSGKEALSQATKLLELVDLSDRMNNYPSQLSGGQQQRVAIARALATNPSVLLCDEVTSALDPNTTSAILDLLKKINQELGVTIVVITHEMRVVSQICDRVAVMDNGKLAEVGEVKDVFVNPKSEVAKRLILPKSEAVKRVDGQKFIRLVFNGENFSEPIISNLALECHVAVNIIAADTKSIGDKYYGQLMLQLPADNTSIIRIKNYLENHGVSYEEVNDYEPQ